MAGTSSGAAAPPVATSIAPPPAPDHTWAMLCHLLGFFGFLGPLIVWLVKRRDVPEVDAHGKASLNFHISMSVYGLIFGVVMMVAVFGVVSRASSEGIGPGFWTVWTASLLVGGGLGVLNIVCIIVASVKANHGELFRYPLSIPFVR